MYTLQAGQLNTQLQSLVIRAGLSELVSHSLADLGKVICFLLGLNAGWLAGKDISIIVALLKY